MDRSRLRARLRSALALPAAGRRARGAAGGGEGRSGSIGIGGSGVLPLSVFAFALRGLSHFSQRIPSEIAAPHMKHLEAIAGFRIGSPILTQIKIDSAAAWKKSS